jgi:hypothetical protein
MTLEELKNQWRKRIDENTSRNITAMNSKDYLLGIYFAIRIKSIVNIRFVNQ